MEKARLRALTPYFFASIIASKFCRNGESPIKGIDTVKIEIAPTNNHLVEMEKARLRALTHFCTQ